jgi:hypothetical protein
MALHQAKRQLSLWNLQGLRLRQQAASDSQVQVARWQLPAGEYVLRVNALGQATVCRKVVIE